MNSLIVFVYIDRHEFESKAISHIEIFTNEYDLAILKHETSVFKITFIGEYDKKNKSAKRIFKTYI